MKKMFVWLGVILFLAGCMVGGVRTPLLEKTPTEHIESATIALVKMDADVGYYPYCTGVWIDKHTILTAAHCVENAGKPENDAELEALLDDPLGLFKAFKEEWNPLGHTVYFMVKSDLDDAGPMLTSAGRVATVASLDEHVDLALLRVGAPPQHDEVQISQDVLPSGMDVICSGHTSGLWWSYSYGRIAATRMIENPDDHKFKTLQISIPIWKGNSGGGAFDEGGKLIGVASFINTTAPNLGFFIHRDIILEFLENSRERPLLRH